VAIFAGSAVMATVTPHGGMLQTPDVSSTHIVFSYANDLWVVPRAGGQAMPLSSPAGRETLPRFSPDGKTIAFVGNYDGNMDLYTLPVSGGVPFRVTYHPDFEQLSDWTADARLIFSSSMYSGISRAPKLFLQDADGGMPELLPVPYGSSGTIDASGELLLYTPQNRDGRTWKRYKGGLASDLWMFNLETHESKKLTDWDGTDTQPMWHGDTVYYLSDAGPAHRLNIWAYSNSTGEHRQVTEFKDSDVRWPAIGPGPGGQGEIVFQNGTDIHLLDLATGQSSPVKVTIPGDRPSMKPRAVDASGFLNSYSISPKGKRVAGGARGDIWSLPAKNGFPRNLTMTSGAAERDPSWSPDGRWIAYFSDESGEYELYVTQSDGKGETRRLTQGSKSFLTNPVWSPDSKKITYGDETGYTLMLHDLDSDKTTRLDRHTQSARFNDVKWSPDSRYIVYTANGDSLLTNHIVIYDVENGVKHKVTGDMFGEGSPVFDPNGKYLFFSTARNFQPTYSDLDSSFAYTGSGILALIPLKADTASPFAPKSDEVEFKKDGDEEEDGDKKDDDKDNKGKGDKKGDKKDGDKNGKDEKKDVEVEIDFDGFESRAIRIPVDPGNFGRIAVTKKGHLVYSRLPVGGNGDPKIVLLDLEDEKHEEKTLVDGSAAFELAADGETMLYLQKGKAFIREASPNGKPEPVATAGMTVDIDPREEWAQILRDTWRRERDYFYDPNMHGVDWEGVYKQYEAMLADCTTRNDVGFLIREMISELNIGHAYYRPAPEEMAGSRRPVGMLGADYELVDGVYRFAGIYGGGPWDIDARGPLGDPGVDVKVGDYLLRVNGVAPDPDKAEFDDDARTVLVEADDGEGRIRYRHWVESNRAYVEEKSGGKVGYIHVPDTGVRGQNELVRQYFGQVRKDALIVDERWNGGGQIPTRFIELLNRPITNYWSVAGDYTWPWPFDAHQGPKCMLINGAAGSGGDAFPRYFRQAGLGKLIGRRTWGGLVGISGVPGLIDGGGVTVPAFAYFDKDGTWGVEGYGVAPDLEVMDDPALMVDGGDPQLDYAVDHMLQEIKTNGYKAPKRPAYPDRSGMGVTEEDR
jgi:tricorn protease